MTTIFIRACRKGKVELARALLERGADLNLIIDYRSTFDFIFNHYRHSDKEGKILELFLEFGYDPNTIHVGKWGTITALDIFCMQDRLDLADIVVKAGADVNLVYTYNHTFLWSLFLHKNVKIVEFLLSHGAKVFINGKSNYDFDKPDCESGRRIQDIMFKHILENERDKMGIALLSMTYNDNYAFLIEVLQKYPEFINLTNENGRTVLMSVCQKDDFTAYYDEESSFYRHVITCDKYIGYEKCECNYDSFLSTIQFLLDNGANVDQTDYRGLSAFGYISDNNIEGMIFMLEHIIGEKIDDKSFGEIFETLAKHGKLQQVKDMLMKDRVSLETVKVVFEGDTTQEVKDFLLKWSNARDDLFGKTKYSLIS